MDYFQYGEIRQWREAYKQFCAGYIPSNENNLQNVFTPHSLCHDILKKLDEVSDVLRVEDSKILCLNLEFVEELIEFFKVKKDRITFVTDSISKISFANLDRYNGINVVLVDFLSDEWRKNMKFDVVVGNPPYQTKSDDNNTKTQAIWPEFIKLSCDFTKENGYTCLVHPSGWRGASKAFEVAKSILEKQVECLEIHNEQDGLKTFGATTRYDWYVRKNTPVTHSTEVKDQDGKVICVNLDGVNFIPNSQLDRIFSMLANNQEVSVEIISDSSYHTQRTERISKIKRDSFIYPVIYSTPVDGPTIWYSNTNQNGHFGISKLILNPCRPIGFVIDENGEYGMSQFCIGIVGDIDYLNMVAKVIKNQKTNGFAEFMESCHFTDKIFNKDIISLFRKDFWKEFVNEDGSKKEAEQDSRINEINTQMANSREKVDTPTCLQNTETVHDNNTYKQTQKLTTSGEHIYNLISGKRGRPMEFVNRNETFIPLKSL